jgi:Family of unknown function (DUF6502)
MPNTLANRHLRLNDPLKDATLSALRRILDPLVDLMIDAGVTVHEYTQLVRERAVHTAAKRVLKDTGRDSKSRIAIITGLPRSEVSRILKSGAFFPAKTVGQHPARKVLAAWFDNPRFLAANGDPAVLPIFGKRLSFEHLVAMHSRGIPVRAMLDELTQLDAVEQLADQRVRAKSRVPILTGLTTGAIAGIADRTRDLLETLTSNLKRSSNPLFVGTAHSDDADLEMVSLVRRDLAEQGTTFINSANSLFGRSSAKSTRSGVKTATKCRLGVTVYYFQDDAGGEAKLKNEMVTKRRKNLRRQRRPTSKRQAVGPIVHSRAKVQL